MQTYTGSCHCGKVRYRVSMELGRVMSCNCSICRRKRALLAFVPRDQFTLESGQDALTDYQFNKHVIHHLFCSSCGVGSFAYGSQADGKQMAAINVRCLEGVDLDKLEIFDFDGKSR